MRSITALPDALLQVREWQHENSCIVFTNGCFDLLHPGHIDYLERARSLGDRLIIGINDDASISRLKGTKRPINNLADRAVMLAALHCVDLVVSFSEDTPFHLIDAMKPDILVKGGDYLADDIVGADIVRATGGCVIVMPFLEGHSSTKLIQRIKKGA